MFWHPWMVALLGVAVWLIIWLVAPLEAFVELDSGALIFIGISYVAFLTGCMVAELTRSSVVTDIFKRQASPWNGAFQPKIYWWCIAISVAAVALRTFDRLVVRGIDYSLGNNEVREQLTASTATPLSALSALVIPFCFLPLVLVLGSRLTGNRTFYLALAVIVFCLPSIEGLAQLSRSTLIISLLLALVTVSCMKFDGKLFVPSLVLPAIVGVIALSLVSTAIFGARLGEFGRTINDSVVESGYAELIRPTIAAQRDMVAGEPVRQAVYNTALPNAMYYVHGLYEFSVLWTRPDTQYFGYGAYTFFPYIKLYSIITGDRSSIAFDEQLLFDRVGVFSTFFGPWWIDFGWLGVVLLFAIGIIVTRLADRSRLGELNTLPLYLFTLGIIFYMPITNIVQSGLGSGLVDQSQKMTVAARAMAERKTVGHRS